MEHVVVDRSSGRQRTAHGRHPLAVSHELDLGESKLLATDFVVC